MIDPPSDPRNSHKRPSSVARHMSSGTPADVTAVCRHIEVTKDLMRRQTTSHIIPFFFFLGAVYNQTPNATSLCVLQRLLVNTAFIKRLIGEQSSSTMIINEEIKKALEVCL
ncbi:hypothetical protein AB3S75_012298 [Citrus x aurantiifolia]